MKNIILAVKGFIMGIANIIPGVSGGTLALTLGIYEEFIGAISHFFSDFKNNLKFLLPIGIGMGLSILTMSNVISASFENFPIPTTLFFMGLVIGGIPMLTRRVKEGKEKGTVEFKNVCFKYPDSDEEVLSDITFTAKPGETTAIIGSTGSGKSTIVNLIPRFYDVTGGELLVDGVNVKDLSQKELRDVIGFVPQKGVLFSGTIESNIKYSNSEMSDEKMIEAAEIAQAVEFIQGKDEKYKTEIAQGGSNVSGGQKQRLSIARAIAKDPEIFVFDDSFSALDFKTDKALREALSEKTENKTVIIVAQRISTILEADQIIVLEEGKVVGYAGLNRVLDEGDVTNIVVAEEYRGRGLGTALTAALLEEGKKEGIQAFTLEVRFSNLPAVRIYEKLGFVQEGIRKRFYEKPVEDARIMWKREPGQ